MPQVFQQIFQRDAVHTGSVIYCMKGLSRTPDAGHFIPDKNANCRRVRPHQFADSHFKIKFYHEPILFHGVLFVFAPAQTTARFFIKSESFPN